MFLFSCINILPLDNFTKTCIFLISKHNYKTCLNKSIYYIINTLRKTWATKPSWHIPLPWSRYFEVSKLTMESPTGLGLSLDQRMEIPLLSISILAYKSYSFHNLASTLIDFHSFSFFTLTRFLGVPIITPNHSFRNKSSKLGVHFLLTAFSSSIYFSYKISTGYQITSSFHDNLQSDSNRFLVHLITFSEQRHIAMIDQKSYKPAYSNLP